MVILFATNYAQQAAFRVKKKQEPTGYLRLPMYVPVTGHDTINVVMLDSLPPPGTAISLWTPEAIVTDYDIMLNSKGEIFKAGGLGDMLTTQFGSFLLGTIDKTRTLILCINQVYLKGKLSKTNWTYRIMLKPDAVAASDTPAKK
jgi:hypothetical protein